ncbi:aspartate aminotransferase family protein, partial [archaeon]|nr:aspartate aminotransferase family protein [archaeon]
MNHEEMEMNYIAPTYGKRGITLVRGEGVYLYDDQGKKYLDCFSNVGVTILGHANPKINDAIKNQIDKLMNLHQSFISDIRAEYSKRIVEAAPDYLTRVFYCNSGTESVEAAIKFARATTGRPEIIATKMGYHGKTMGALSLTKTAPKYNNAFMPLLEDVNHFSYNDAQSLKEIISEKTAAVILEPIQGEGGIKPATKEFLEEVKKICDENGTLLIFDEVQTGMGRTGKLFAHTHFGVSCDIMCLAKGPANGVPIGMTLISDKVSEKLFKGAHTNTFGGNPLACAAGLAVLDYIDENKCLENAEEVGNYFMEQIRAIDSPLIREVRG